MFYQYGKQWYDQLVAKNYDRFMDRVEANHLQTIRERLLSSLEGNILEIGAGTGVNFPRYSLKANVVAIEPDSFMANLAKAKLEEENFQANISIQECTIDAFTAKENSFDAIVCTLVLCTIPKPKEALQKLKTLLKPNGQLLVLEHIRPKAYWKAKLYDVATPVWKCCAQGCHLNRPTDEWIKTAGFQPIEEQYFDYKIPFYEGVFKRSEI
jgi:ubiquinone/menaquinone biosynthesis C-methylase UbiE